MQVVKIIPPDEYLIRVIREGNKARLIYREFFRKKEDMTDEQFKQMVALTIAEMNKFIPVLKKLSPEISIEFDAQTKENEIEAIVRVDGPFDLIASMITSEFLAFSGIGKMTLTDILSFGTLAFLHGARTVGEEAMKEEGPKWAVGEVE